MTRITHSLAIKLTACVVGGMALLFSIYGYWNLRLWRQSQQEIIFQSTDRISDTIRRSIRYSMLRNEREDVFNIINTIGHENGISRIRIFNKEGKISFSTDANEVGQFVDKKAEACYACHAQAQPLARLDRPDRMRIYSAHDGTRVLGLIRPIENEADCSNAACHAHTDSSQVLGVLDTNLARGHGPCRSATPAPGGALYRSFPSGREPVHFLVDLADRAQAGASAYGGHARRGAGQLGLCLAGNQPGRNWQPGHFLQSHDPGAEESAGGKSSVDGNARRPRAAENRRTRTRLSQPDSIGEDGLPGKKLAVVVAHEINNPLAGILTYSKLISRMADKSCSDNKRLGEAKSYLQIIEGESRRCGGIVKNLLTFARQTPINPQKNDLNAIIERCLLLVGHQMDLQSIDLQKKLEPQLPQLYCDAGQVQQALLVILMNAVEAMPHGGRLGVESAYDPARRLGRVVVSDEGTGIPPDVLSHIFEPFFTTKEEGKGTGLGLAIALGIIQQHGGNIEVESSEQKGTTFTVLLPEEPPVSVSAA